MSKGIYFDGRRIIRPQAITKIDDSGMYARGLGGGNTLALVGECTGGEPQKVMYFTDPSYAKAVLRSGDLLTAIQRAYDPSDSVPGAYLVAAIRVNPAEQASLTLKDAYGNPLIDLTSYDYGVWNNQIRARVQTGTGSLGKKLTFSYGLSFDQGDTIYRKSFALGMSDALVQSATLTIDAFAGTLATTVSALPQEVTYPDGSSPITFASPENIPFTTYASEYLYMGSDLEFSSILFTMSVINSTGAATPTLEYWNGTTWDDVTITDGTINTGSYPGCPLSKTGSMTFTKPSDWVKGATDGPTGDYYWVRLSMSAALNTGTDVTSITLGRGLSINLSSYPTIQQLVDYLDSQSGYQAVALTTNPDGESSTELDDITAGSLLPFDTYLSSSYSSGKTLSLNDSSGFAVGDYVIITKLDGSAYETRRVTGFGSSANQITIDSALSTSYSSGVTSTAVRQAKALNSDLQSVIDWINAGNTSYVSAAYAASGTNRAALANIADTYLSGGTDGTTDQEDWDAALALLQTEDVPLISCVSYDPAVWASLSTHCSYMSTVGKKERIGFCGGFDSSYGSLGLGLWNSYSSSQSSIDKMLEYAIDLNSDRMVYVGPGFKAYDENGTLITFAGHISAALVAGMAAGVDVATALTHQYIKVLGLEYNFQWADLDRLLEGGVCPFEYDPGTGYRVCQSITSWLVNDKYNRREMSVRRTADYVARQVRDRLEQDFVGKKGTMTTLISIKNATESVLAQMYRAELLAGNAENPPYKNIQCRLDGDTCYVDFECSPVIPINYIPITIHLTVFTTTLTA